MKWSDWEGVWLLHIRSAVLPCLGLELSQKLQQQLAVHSAECTGSCMTLHRMVNEELTPCSEVSVK